jgi:hypothetical protein
MEEIRQRALIVGVAKPIPLAAMSPGGFFCAMHDADITLRSETSARAMP